MEKKCQWNDDEVPDDKVDQIEFEPAKLDPRNHLDIKIVHDNSVRLHQFSKT